MNYKLFIGIDQSKLTFDAVALKGPEDQQTIHQQFKNDRKGFSAMIKWARAQGNCELQEILFCSENTGVYSLNLCIYLAEIKADLWLESPIQIKRSAGFVRGKSDKADALMIANYCYVHCRKAKLYTLPTKPIMALKQLLTFRERLIKMQTRLKITAKEMKEFDADMSGIVAGHSEGLIRSIAKKIERINEEIMMIIRKNEDLNIKFELAKSVHGIGDQTASAILVSTNGFTSFTDCRKFSCYCGIAPFEYSSGSSIKGKTRISHYGNKKLKSLLTMCALNTIKKDNEFKRYYDRRIADGKSAMSTINIIRNKLISRVFAAIERGTPYEFERNSI